MLSACVRFVGFVGFACVVSVALSGERLMTMEVPLFLWTLLALVASPSDSPTTISTVVGRHDALSIEASCDGFLTGNGVPMTHCR